MTDHNSLHFHSRQSLDSLKLETHKVSPCSIIADAELQYLKAMSLEVTKAGKQIYACWSAAHQFAVV